MTTNVKKSSTAQVKTKSGTEYSYKFADLATIHEELGKQGITYYQYTEYDEKADADYIYTVLKYGDDDDKEAKESGPLRGVKIMEGDTLAGGNIAQQYGSALTYARRYSLLMALGWATEDDDAASVGSAPAQTKSHSAYTPHDGGDRLDFDVVKQYLEQLTTVADVKAAKVNLTMKYPKMTEKQRSAIDRIFASRIEAIENPGEPRGWQPAKSVK